MWTRELDCDVKEQVQEKKKKRNCHFQNQDCSIGDNEYTMIRIICGCCVLCFMFYVLCFMFYVLFSLALFSIPRCLPLFYPFGAQRVTV